MTGLQNQAFAVFMLLVVFAFLVYQSMPHFVMQREIYEARERASKMYSWPAFMLSTIVAEIPWSTLAALLMYVTFYYLVGMHHNAEPTDTVTQRGGLMLLLFWAFMIFESTFANMVIAGVELAEVGATIALLLFALASSSAGMPNRRPHILDQQLTQDAVSWFPSLVYPTSGFSCIEYLR